MPAINGPGPRPSCAPFAAVVSRCRGQIVSEVRREVRPFVGDERGISGVCLIPEMAVADDARRPAAADEAAAVRHEQMADRIEIQPPLIAAAVGEDLELMPDGMVAPDAGVERQPL